MFRFNNDPNGRATEFTKEALAYELSCGLRLPLTQKIKQNLPNPPEKFEIREEKNPFLVHLQVLAKVKKENPEKSRKEVARITNDLMRNYLKRKADVNQLSQ